LRHAIEVLGGISKKRTKELEKEYAALSQAPAADQSTEQS